MHFLSPNSVFCSVRLVFVPFDRHLIQEYDATEPTCCQTMKIMDFHSSVGYRPKTPTKHEKVTFTLCISLERASVKC